MGKIKIIEEEPITISEVKSILEKEVKKRELDLREKKTLEYAKRLGKLSKSKIEELKNKLKGLGIDKLKDPLIIKIIDNMPETKEELKIVLADKAKLFKDAELEKIVKALE